jgi:hypothetical protein
VGNALGFALIMGMTAAIGAALPLVILHTKDVGTREGIFTWSVGPPRQRKLDLRVTVPVLWYRCAGLDWSW